MSVHRELPAPGALSSGWCLDEDIVFLNHGSFGACPLAVMDFRKDLLARIERNPMDFLLQEYQPLLEDVLRRLESFTGAQSGSIVIVENATTAVNTILANLTADKGDTLLVADQEYFSSANALEVLAMRKGLRVRKVELPWPASEQAVIDAFAEVAEAGARYALVDHVVSSTGMVLPLRRIVSLLGSMGVETVVDGAHGPGQLDLQLEGLGCLAYTGNCHKWLCSPRSAALLYVRPDFQRHFLPLQVSHLPEDFQTGISDFQLRFRWNGTPDPTPALSIPFAMDHMASLLKGGWEVMRRRNRSLALEARDMLCEALGVAPPCPDSMVGSMASVELPSANPAGPRDIQWMDPLQARLRSEYGIVVPVTEIQGRTRRLIRISAQLYNSPEQYRYLVRSLLEALGR